MPEKTHLGLIPTSEQAKRRQRACIRKVINPIPLAAKQVLYCLLLQKSDTRQPLDYSNGCRVTANDLAALSGSDIKTAHEQLGAACKAIRQHLVKINHKDLLAPIKGSSAQPATIQQGKIEPNEDTNKNGYFLIHIVEWTEYSPEEGYIQLGLNETFAPYLTLSRDYAAQLLLTAIQRANRR